MSENTLAKRITARREADAFVDITDIVMREFGQRIQDIGEDAASLEFAASGYLTDADHADQIAVLAKCVSVLARKVLNV